VFVCLSSNAWSFRNGLLAAGLVDGQVAVWNPRLRYVPLPAASSPISCRSFATSNSHCAPGSDTPEDEGYFDRDFPVEIDYDYLSARRPQATPLHAHGRSGILAKDVAGEQSEEDTSDWEVVSNSGSDMVAMFAKHVGPVRPNCDSRFQFDAACGFEIRTGWEFGSVGG
jgi:hypothetical protein